MQSKDMQTLINNLEKWRIEHNMSQAAFAKAIKVSPSTYTKLLSGDISTISADTIKAVYFVTGYLCFQLMDVKPDPYLRLGFVSHDLTPAEQEFLISIAELIIKMRKDNDNR